MHSWLRYLLITMGSFIACTNLAAADSTGEENVKIEAIKIIEPAEQQRDVHDAAIDTEQFEVGIFTGFIAVEDFNSNSVIGLSGAYHLNKRMMLLAHYGSSDIDRASFEINTNSSFLSNADRKFTYVDLQFAYNLFPGKSFFGTGANFDSGIYLFAGLGKTKFAGDSGTGLVFGSSYRMVITDYMTVNFDFKDHLFKRDFTEDKQTHNIEFTAGVNVLF